MQLILLHLKIVGKQWKEDKLCVLNDFLSLIIGVLSQLRTLKLYISTFLLIFMWGSGYDQLLLIMMQWWYYRGAERRYAPPNPGGGRSWPGCGAGAGGHHAMLMLSTR